MAIVHDLFQNTLLENNDLRTPVSVLDAAVALAPTDPVVLGSRVVFGAGASFATAARLLEESPVTQEHLSLQFLRERAASRRLSFTTEQTQLLLDSRDPVDMALLTMDRLFWLQLGTSTGMCKELLGWLDRARLNSREADPILYGATAVLAGLSGDREMVDSCVAALERLWPEDVAILSWGPLAYEHLEKGSGLQHMRKLAARFPDSESLRLRIAAQLWKSRQYEEHDRLAATLPPRLQLRSQLLSASLRGDQAQLRALRAQLDADENESQEQKDLALCLLAPELDWNATARVLAVDAPDMILMLRLAQRHPPDEQRTQLLDALDRVLAAKPPTTPAVVLAHALGKELGELEHGAPTVAAIADLRELPDSCLQFAMEILRQAKDWISLQRFATYALEHVEGDRLRGFAAFHLGIAAARLGDDEAAMRWFDKQKEITGRPYVEVFQEQARYYVSESTPADKRDPARALKLCDDLDRQLQGRGRSPWFGAIRAEVEFANERPAEALLAAQEALQMQRRGKQAWLEEKILGFWSAPADIEERLEAAIARYRAAAGSAGDAPRDK